MKTYAPKGLRGGDLRQLLDELHATPAQIGKFLDVTERSVWRWLAEGTAPRAVLYALWHETPRGRETSALDVGNELTITRATVRIQAAQVDTSARQLARVLAISDTGAANDALLSGPVDKFHNGPFTFKSSGTVPWLQSISDPDNALGPPSATVPPSVAAQ